MNTMNHFIKDIQFDEVKRIIILVQPLYQAYLQSDKSKQMLKKAVMDSLKSDFVKLEVGKTGCRVTVQTGSEERSMKKVKEELVKGLEMAMNFMRK